MKDLGGLMKQAQALQEKLQAAQAEIAALEMTGRAGAGLVEITLNGAGDVRGVKIDPSLADPAEIEVLEDLIKAAFADAKRQLDETSKAKLADAAGPFAGMMPQGFKPPF